MAKKRLFGDRLVDRVSVRAYVDLSERLELARTLTGLTSADVLDQALDLYLVSKRVGV